MSQREVWQATITDTSGNIVPDAQITVYEQDGITLATIYGSLTGGTKANPFIAGTDGVARFYAESGRYVVRAFKDSQIAERVNVDLSMKALREDLAFVGSFQDGCTVTSSEQIVIDKSGNGLFYSWGGALPKVVPASSTVDGTGGEGANAWTNRGDAALRSALAQPESSVMVGGITAKRIGDNLNELGVRNAKFRDKYSGKVNLCAHRGREYAPENTVQAINALPPECNIIEFDVRLTSDGVPVCIHDATVDRTTDGSGPVTGFTFAQIRELDAGSWYADDYAGIKIPTLMEYIEASKRKGIEVLLMQDYSTPNAANTAIIYGVLKDMNALDMVVYMASSNERITVIRDNCPDVLLGAFSATATGRFDLLRANNGILALTPPGDSNVISFKDFYKTVKEAGMVAGASKTNDPSNVERGYEEFGCDLILTDFVSTFTKYRGL